MLYIGPLKSEGKIPSLAVIIMGVGVPRTLLVEVPELEANIELSDGVAGAPAHHSSLLKLRPPM